MAGKHSVDQYAETKAPKGSGRKKLDSIEVRKAKNGGHVLTHRYTSEGPMYHPPEDHVFGPGDGSKMLAHLKGALGVSDNDGDEG